MSVRERGGGGGWLPRLKRTLGVNDRRYSNGKICRGNNSVGWKTKKR